MPEKYGDAVKAVRAKLAVLCDDQRRAQELVASAQSRLNILNGYGKILGQKKAPDFERGLETYRQGREGVFRDQMDGAARDRELTKEINTLVAEENRLLKLEWKEQRKAVKEKEKIKKERERAREKERLREAERLSEKRRIRKERQSFWPRFCWTARITLDAVSFTPSSSRRSSIASASDIVKVVPEKETASAEHPDASTFTCDLSLSYVTSSAWWSPSYDLALTTTSNTALLCFDAQLTNRTSENWANCKLVLSTSQTTFSGIQDAIPALVPWRVRLGAKGFGLNASDVLDSREERAEKGGWLAQQNAWGVQKSRNHLYGLGDHGDILPSARGLTLPPPPPCPALPASDVFGSARGQQQQQLQQQLQQQQQQQTLLPYVSQAAEDLFGSAQESKKMSRKAGGPSKGLTSNPFAPGNAYGAEPSYMESPEQDDAETMLNRNPELAFQESEFEETGMTTTYDLPGLKTLNTSSTASKQRVARISFSSVAFSHTIVAKYRPVAYLKAKLRNASKLTLLKGPVGLSLDGSFIGRSTLPRCSAGDIFTTSLGIDPAIKVSYPKPDVKRSTSGLFTKEDSFVYTRTITISNTRASSAKPINIVALDQVPVSEDDKLRIEVMNPRGMAVGSNGVAAGLPGKEGKDGKDWGRATAALKKAGEVSWNVVLNPGRSVKLALEYEVALPAGDHVIQC